MGSEIQFPLTYKKNHNHIILNRLGITLSEI